MLGDMGLRFRRRLKIAPGFTLNLGTRSASLSAGSRCTHVTVGRQGVRGTIGLPGTGLYYTTQLSGQHHQPSIAIFRNPTNTYEEVIRSPGFWCLIFGGFYFL